MSLAGPSRRSYPAARDDAPESELRTGMRVRVRWSAETVGAITDIACFEPLA